MQYDGGEVIKFCTVSEFSTVIIGKLETVFKCLHKMYISICVQILVFETLMRSTGVDAAAVAGGGCRLCRCDFLRDFLAAVVPCC